MVWAIKLWEPSHLSALVLTVLFGYRFRPWTGALLRVFLWTNFYAALIMLVNLVTGGNYGYLQAKPMNAPLLDCPGRSLFSMAPLELVALRFFFILYAAFFFLDRVRGNC